MKKKLQVPSIGTIVHINSQAHIRNMNLDMNNEVTSSQLTCTVKQAGIITNVRKERDPYGIVDIALVGNAGITFLTYVPHASRAGSNTASWDWPAFEPPVEVDIGEEDGQTTLQGD